MAVSPLALVVPKIETPADLGGGEPEAALEPPVTVPVAVLPPVPVAEVDALVLSVTGLNQAHSLAFCNTMEGVLVKRT